MNSIDDDFGDLYADVEVQASSAINGVPDFTKFHIEPEGDANINSTKNHSPEENSVSNAKKHNPATDEFTRAVENSATQKAASSEAEGSDSEDDLNIVLNDEDCKKFPVTSRANARNGGYEEDEDGDFGIGPEQNRSEKHHKLGDHVGDESELNSSGHGGERGNGVKGGYNSQYSQYKYIRHHVSAFSSNMRVNGSAKVVSLSSMLGRGDWEGNGCNRLKGSSSGQVYNVCANLSSVVPQCGYGFSLPWYRTILDVNIDTFEVKPWSYPGADITDFFNFGFNEESWKGYCKSLEKFRQRTSMRSRIPVHECSKLNQDYEIRYENEKIVQEEIAEENTQVEPSTTFSDGARPSELPRGRAIEVEDSIGERQPSMDIRRPRSRDSDVVIQITVQDAMVDSSGLGKEELGHTNSSVQEASDNEYSHMDDKGNTQFSGSSCGDELSVESLEENFRISDVSYPPRRCSEPVTASNQMSLDTDNQRNGKISAVIGHNHIKVNACSSEGIAGEMEDINKEEDGVHRNTSSSDPCVIETELSLGDRSHFSPTPSCSVSGSEASKFQCDSLDIHSPLRQSITELHESDYKNFKRNGIKMKPEDGKRLSRHKSTVREKRKHHSRRPHSAVKEDQSDVDPSPISNTEDGRKKYVRHESPIQEERKCSSGRLCIVSEQKIHTKNVGDASPLSDAEELYDRDHTAVDYSRRKARLHGSGYHDREDFSYYREAGLSSGYENESFAENHACAVHSKYRHTKSHQSFREKVDRYVRRSCNERGYFNERRAIVDGEDDIDREFYHCGRGRFIEDMNPNTYRESRWLPPNYSSNHKGRDSKWRKENDKLQFRKRTDYDGCLLNCEHEDDLLGEKYGRYVSFRERDSFVETYERDYPVFGREVEFSGRRGRYGNAPGLHLDMSCSMGTDNKRNAYRRSFSYQSFRESRPAKGRNGANVFRVTEACGRQRRQILEEEGRDGWFRSSDDTKDTEDSLMYMDDQLGRRRYGRRSKELHWTKDELIIRHWDNELNNNGASIPYEEASMHDSTKYEFSQDEMHIDDIEWGHHRYEMMREGSACCLDRNTKTIYRDEHEQTVLRCRDSVDMIVGEGKFPERYSNGRRLVWNDRVEKDLKFVKRQRTLRDTDGSCGWKAVQTDLNIEDSKNNEKWLGKFPGTEYNVDLDIEEGQIILEEPKKVDHLEKKFVSETSAQTHNVKRRTHTENSSNGNKVDIEKQRILETLAKMEKRRERFKEPITVKKELETTLEPQAELIFDTTKPKQQRPARKRRWGGS